MTVRRVILVLVMIAIGVTAAWPGWTAWSRSTPQAGFGSPTVTWDAATAHVIVADAGGRILHSMPLARPRDPGAARGQLPSDNGMVTLTGDQQRGYAFVAELDKGLIYALSARDGHLLWRASLLPLTTPRNGRAAIQSPVIDEQQGHVISADIRDGRLVVLRESDGHLLASQPIPAGGLDLVVVRKFGRILVFHGGQVDVLDAAHGRRLRTLTIGTIYQYGPAVVMQSTGRVFLSSNMPTSITMLDGATGRIMRVTRVPLSPGLPLPDERAGVVYIPLWGSGGTVISGEPQPSREATLDGHSGALLHIGPPGRTYVSSDVLIPADSWGWLPAGLRRLIPFIPPPPAERRHPYELHFPTLSPGHQ